MTPVLNVDDNVSRWIGTTKVTNGKFIVKGEPGEFNWVVYGERLPINIEPLKIHEKLCGNSPYQWLEHWY